MSLFHKQNKPSGGVRHAVKRVVGGMIAAVTLAAGLLVSGTANAAPIFPDNGDDGVAPATTYWGTPGIKFTSNRGASMLGIMGYINGKNAYCTEWGANLTTNYPSGGTVESLHDPDANRIAYLAVKYQNDTSDLTQAAIAYLAHQKLDQNRAFWNSSVGYVPGDVVAKANQLWTEALSNAVETSQSYTFTAGKRQGNFAVQVKNGKGEFRPYVKVHVHIDGPAVWNETGTADLDFVSPPAGETRKDWKATGDGTVSFTVSYPDEHGLGKYQWPEQKMVFDNDSLVEQPIAFDVNNQTDLKVTTEATNTFDHAGDTRPVHDVIHLEGGTPGEPITGKVILNWDGNPYGDTVKQKAEKTLNVALAPTVNSPEFTPADFGWSKWKAGRYWFDVQIPKQGDLAKAVDTDDREKTETREVDAPSITTDVSKRVAGINEKFYDTAKITGHVARGSYVKFEAWDAVPDKPDTSVNKLVDQIVQITDEQADASSEQGSFTIDSQSTSTDHEGYVYWKATLYNQRGDVLDTHELGIETETVHVLPVKLESQVTNEQVTFDQWFGDKATVTGIIEPGSYLSFQAYGPTLMDPILPDGSDNPAVTALKPLYEARINVSDKQAADSHNRPQTFYSKLTDYERSAMVTSASGVDGGFVYWKVTLYGPDGLEQATHQLGVPSETVRVQMPTIETQVSDSEIAVGDEFHDE